MRKEELAARAACECVHSAIWASNDAQKLLTYGPTAWDYADQAYWLCRAAKDAVQKALDTLDPKWVEKEWSVAGAYLYAKECIELAQAAADELVSLAEAAGHEIRR